MTAVLARSWAAMDRTARIALAALTGMIVACVVVPLFAASEPLAIGDVLATRLLPPLSQGVDGELHLLGTDRFGRDLLLRMLLAGRVSLAVGIVGSILAAGLGTLVGAIAAWRGGWVDRLLMAIADALLSIPRLVLLLVCAALWAPGLRTVVVVLVATGWMGVARMIRAELLGVTSLPYVQSAVALGVAPWRVLWRHALPNALGPAIVATTLGVGNAILLESGLSFLGMGIQPPQPSWGNMIAGGRDLIVTAPWVAIAPGVALVLTVLASTLIGDSLRDRLAGERVAGRRDLADRA